MRWTGGGSPPGSGAAAALAFLFAFLFVSTLAGSNTVGPSPGGAAAGSSAGAAAAGAVGRSDGALLGAWRPREYRLAGGEVLPVDGRIVFLGEEGAAEGEWLVVFFVPGGGDGGEPEGSGTPLRGSAEGGQFFRDGETLTLTHAYHLSAGEAVGPLPEAPLRMAARSIREAAERHREPCRFTIAGDRLTLFFPSGNSMVFSRV